MKATDEDQKYDLEKGNDTDEKERRDHEIAITSMFITKAKHLLITPNHSSKKQNSK